MTVIGETCRDVWMLPEGGWEMSMSRKPASAEEFASSGTVLEGLQQESLQTMGSTLVPNTDDLLPCFPMWPRQD